MSMGITKPLWVACAVAFGLAASTGTALSQDQTCEGGVIQDVDVQGSIVVDNERVCLIDGVTVAGSVNATNTEELVIQNTSITGELDVKGGRNVTITNTDSSSGINVIGNERAYLALNEAIGEITLSNNVSAYMIQNAASILFCEDNNRLFKSDNATALDFCIAD